MSVGDRPKYKNARSYVLSGVTRHPLKSVVALMLTILGGLIATLPFVYVGDAVDVLVASGLGIEFVTIVWSIALLGLLYIAINFAAGGIWAVVVSGWERDARQELFEELQDHSLAFHDQIDSKRLLSISMQDIGWIRMALNPNLRLVLTTMAVFLLTGGILWLTEPIIGLVMFLGFPFYLFFAYRYASIVEPIRRERAKRMERLTSVSQEVFRGIEVVRAFGKEGYEKNKFHDVSMDYAESVEGEGRLAAFYIPQLILVAITAFAFVFGGFQVLSGVLTVGGLVEILALLLALDGQSAWLPRSLLTLRGALVNADRILELLRWKEPLIEPGRKDIEVDWKGDIIFENVSFAYPNGNEKNAGLALRNVSFRIPGGSKVALIGGPGGGKTSVLKLLLRFYDPTEGRITIGGRDLRQIHSSEVRTHVGLVEQDVFLFKMSIKDNITFGKKDATQEEIVAAAKNAQAHEFIMSTPNGYDSQVGERGFTLSGGQRQRLAIARTLLYDPSILLLDDSTSAIDAKTEYLMRKALDKASEGRTTITVTQRLRTLLESDLVIIVDRGELVAIGSHEYLLETSTEYRRIFETLPETRHMVENVALVGGVA